MAGGTMGQVHHGSATTAAAIRRAIQHSQESLRALAKRYGVNQKTIAKWKRRTSVADVPTGPTEPRSTSANQRLRGGGSRALWGSCSHVSAATFDCDRSLATG